MPEVTVYNIEGKETGKATLNDAVFGADVNESVMHQVVVAHLANRRQGTQSALTRAEVRGGGIKPYRQKGTGRARQGSTRAPQWTHGGVVFAPKPRDYSQKINKKMRRAALASALSMKLRDSEMIVLDNIDLAAPKTREMVKVLSNLKVDGKALIITDVKNDSVVRAAGNLQGVKTTIATTLNVYDVVNCDACILTCDAVKVIEEVFA